MVFYTKILTNKNSTIFTILYHFQVIIVHLSMLNALDSTDF